MTESFSKRQLLEATYQSRSFEDVETQTEEQTVSAKDYNNLVHRHNHLYNKYHQKKNEEKRVEKIFKEKFPEQEIERDSWSKEHSLEISKEGSQRYQEMIKSIGNKLQLCYYEDVLYDIVYQHWLVKDVSELEKNTHIIEFVRTSEQQFEVLIREEETNTDGSFRVFDGELVEEFEKTPKVVDRIKEVVGATNHSLLLRNSEHIARYIYSGTWFSFQLVDEDSEIIFILSPDKETKDWMMTFPSEIRPADEKHNKISSNAPE